MRIMLKEPCVWLRVCLMLFSHVPALNRIRRKPFVVCQEWGVLHVYKSACFIWFSFQIKGKARHVLLNDSLKTK